MTWTEVVTSALRMIGQLGPGQTASTTEATQALFILNRMFRAWSIDRLLVWNIARNFYTLTAGEVDFILGDISDRPVRIERASYTSDSGITETPVALLDAQRWQRGDNGVYFDGGYSQGVIYVRPAATGTEELILYVWTPIEQITDASDTVELPEGYEEAIATNLAIRLYMEWRKSPNVRATDISDVRALARESLAAIKSFNAPAPVLNCDAAIVGRGSFDILRGDYR